MPQKHTLRTKYKSVKKIKTHLFLVLLLLLVIWLFLPVFSEKKNSPGHIIIRDRNGVLMTDKANENGYSRDIDLHNYSDIESLPIIRDIVAIEDKRFYKHYGIDVLAKMRTMKNNVSSGEITG